jgi:hypothetical protein
MAKFNIPEEDWEAFINLFSLKPEKKKAFLEIIKDPENVPHADDFAKHFSALSGKDRKEAKGVIEVLFKLYNLYDYTGEDIESIVAAVIDSFREIDRKEIKKVSPTNIKSFRLFVKELLLLHETLGVRAKAYRLMPQHQHTFRRSEIYSDIRAVFRPDNPDIRAVFRPDNPDIRAVFRPDNPDIKPAAAVIVHSLKIDYYEDYEEKAFYFGLSINDLNQLKNSVERAIKKYDCLKTMIIDNLAIQCLEDED